MCCPYVRIKNFISHFRVSTHLHPLQRGAAAAAAASTAAAISSNANGYWLVFSGLWLAVCATESVSKTHHIRQCIKKKITFSDFYRSTAQKRRIKNPNDEE